MQYSPTFGRLIKDQIINAKVAVSDCCDYQRGCCNIYLEIGRRIYKILAILFRCYGVCLGVLLSVVDIKIIPVGLAYAIWAGAGTALVALVAWLFMGQKLDLPSVIGIVLIVAGVLVLNLFSKSEIHRS